MAKDITIEITATDTAQAELRRAVIAMRKAQPFTRKAKRALSLFCYYAVNAFLSPFDYRWLDARYSIGREIRFFWDAEDISYTTAKALVARRAKKSKSGLALRFKTDDTVNDDLIRVLGTPDGKPITYWQRGVFSWRLKS